MLISKQELYTLIIREIDKMADKKYLAIELANKELGISQGTYYAIKKYSENPTGENPLSPKRLKEVSSALGLNIKKELFEVEIDNNPPNNL